MSKLLKELQEQIEEGGEVWPSNATQVDSEISSEHRWFNRVRTVYEQDGEYVAIFENVGLTEYQEDTEPDYEVFEVEPYEETVTKYRTKS